MEIPRGDVHSRSAIHPVMRRPMVFDIPTTDIKKAELEDDNPFWTAIWKKDTSYIHLRARILTAGR